MKVGFNIIIPVLFGLIIFSSCSHKISRTGYNLEKEELRYCDVPIKIYEAPASDVATKIGEVKLGETGFSTRCSEQDAIDSFKKEACSIGADLIVITKERRPGFWSSCYRAKAVLYKFNDPSDKTDVKSNERFAPNLVLERVALDKKGQWAMAISGVAVAILIVVLLQG